MEADDRILHATTIAVIGLLLVIPSAPLASARTCTPAELACQDGSTTTVGADPWTTTGAGDGPVGDRWGTTVSTAWSALPPVRRNLSADRAPVPTPEGWVVVDVVPRRGPDGYTLSVVVLARFDNGLARASTEQSADATVPARPGEGGVVVGVDGAGEGDVDPTAWAEPWVHWVDREGGDWYERTGMSGSGIFSPVNDVNRTMHDLEPFPLGASLEVPPATVAWNWSADACAGACRSGGTSGGDAAGYDASTVRTGPVRSPGAAPTRRAGVDGWQASTDAAARGPAPAAGPDGPVRVALLVTLAAAAAVWILYRRLTAEEILGNDLRQAILDVVADRPGLHASALARRLDVAVTTILYHVEVLEDAGHLTVKRSDGQVTCFSADRAGTIVERELILALRTPGKADLLEALRREPGLNLSEAARRLDRNRSTIKRHADELVDRGLVAARTEGRSRRLELTSEAASAWSAA